MIWAERVKTPHYVRHSGDSPLICPYCNNQFNADWRTRGPQSPYLKMYWQKQCKTCGHTLYFRLVDAKTVREKGIKDAVITKEEYEERVKRFIERRHLIEKIPRKKDSFR